MTGRGAGPYVCAAEVSDATVTPTQMSNNDRKARFSGDVRYR